MSNMSIQERPEKIKMSIFSGVPDVPVQYPWRDVYIQGGTKGLVFQGMRSYTTAFVEVFSEGEDFSFIRGEGETVQEAESSAWEKYQKAASCAEHVYEPRGYKNGLGFCVTCGRMKSKAITPEELGLFCTVCKLPTYGKESNDLPVCDEHHPGRKYLDQFDALKASSSSSSSSSSLEQDDDELFSLLKKYHAATL